VCLVDVSDRKTVKTMTRHRSPAPPWKFESRWNNDDY
jgi:hypothetical protein